jgi:hypothetical protein
VDAKQLPPLFFKLKVMSIEKIKVASPDLIIKRADQSEAALARVAHVNEIVRQINEVSSTVGTLGDTADLTGTTVATLRTQTEARLQAIETKLDALITALG